MGSTFKGGIHPPENKHITEEFQFTNLSIPQLCYVPLQQHIGAPAKPVVEVGDSVEEGQLIGAAEGFVSANVHAPIPGKVIEITSHPVSGGFSETIVIEAEGAFSASGKQGESVDWTGISKDEILNKVRDAGIVGLGGAAFPTSVKLSPPPEKSIDTLVINGAECEPYLTVDDMLMKSFPEEIFKGVQITLKVLGIEKAVIGIEDNKGEAAKKLQETLNSLNLPEKITVVPLKTKYPQGAEKQLIYSLLGREVPSKGLPMDIGVVVQNVGTILAIYEAVVLNKPLFERYITVSGTMINKPGNFKVRIGTKLSDIVEECGGLKGDPAKIVLGGPMCGASINNLDIPVVKGTSGVLFLSEKESSVDEYLPCIRCGKCVAECPVGLVPCDIGTAVEMNRLDIAEGLNPYDCIMCSSCAYSCPAKRPLSHFIKLAQERLKQKK
jgi:electron transport complex protein RnfC